MNQTQRVEVRAVQEAMHLLRNAQGFCASAPGAGLCRVAMGPAVDAAEALSASIPSALPYAMRARAVLSSSEDAPSVLGSVEGALLSAWRELGMRGPIVDAARAVTTMGDPPPLGGIPTTGGDVTNLVTQNGTILPPSDYATLQQGAQDESWVDKLKEGKLTGQEEVAAVSAIAGAVASFPPGNPVFGAEVSALFEAVYQIAAAIFGEAGSGAGDCASADENNPYGSADPSEFAFPGGYTAPAAGSFAAYFEGLALADWNANANCLYTDAAGNLGVWSPLVGYLRLITLLGTAITAWNATRESATVAAWNTARGLGSATSQPVTYSVQVCGDTSCAGEYGTNGDPLSQTINATGTMTGPPVPQFPGIPTQSVDNGTTLSITVNGGPALPTLPADGSALIIVQQVGAAFSYLPPPGMVWAPLGSDPRASYQLDDVTFAGSALEFLPGDSGMTTGADAVRLVYQGGGWGAAFAWADPSTGAVTTSYLVPVENAIVLSPGSSQTVTANPGQTIALVTPDGSTSFVSATASGQLSPVDNPSSVPWEAAVYIYGGGPAQAVITWTDASGAVQTAGVSFATAIVTIEPPGAEPQLLFMVPGGGVQLELPAGAIWQPVLDSPTGTFQPDLGFQGGASFPRAWVGPIMAGPTDPAIVSYAGGGGTVSAAWIDASGNDQVTWLQILEIGADLNGDGTILDLQMAGACVIAIYPPVGGAWLDPASQGGPAGAYALDAFGFTGSLSLATEQLPSGFVPPVVPGFGGMTDSEDPAILWFGGGAGGASFQWVDSSGNVQIATLTVEGGAPPPSACPPGQVIDTVTLACVPACPDGTAPANGVCQTAGAAGPGSSGGSSSSSSSGGVGPAVIVGGGLVLAGILAWLL